MPIIKSIYWNQATPDTFVYLFPFKDITMGSVLTVNESQEAYFFKNGNLCDRFGPGRHVLSSNNLPILEKIINIPSGGDSTFKASIWFVSKLEKRNMLWGGGGLRIVDPYFQVPIKLSARGQYGIRIKDGGLLLLKFVGTQAIFTTEDILDQFRIDVLESVKVSISRYMKEKKININELGTEYKKLSNVIATELQHAFDEYGVELLNFNIEDINFDENDKGYQTVMEGIAEQAKLNKLGVNYVQQKQIDIAQTLAANQGAGTLMGAGIGLSVGQQVGDVFKQTLSQSAIAPNTQEESHPAYYVAVDGKTTGPFRWNRIKEMVISGDIVGSTYVYKVAGTPGVKAKDEPEIVQLLNSILPPPPPPPSE